MTYLSINIIEYIQDLYEENYNTLMNDMKKILNKWKEIPCSRRGRLKDVSSSQLIYRSNAIPIKIPAKLFWHIDKLILKFLCRGKRPSIANTILEN